MTTTDNNRIFNEEGLSLLKNFEGFRLLAYQDGGGVWTIGYGHTGPEVVKGLRWTKVQIEDQLRKDLLLFCDGVSKLITVPLTANQFSALVCFAFNVGLEALRKSTLLKLLNNGATAAASEEFLRWCKDNGKVVAGLLRRRKAEKALFDKA